LGGNRSHQNRNLVAVFLLCGLWHGASWTFVVWGAWHGAFLMLERTFSARAPALLRHLYVLTVVLVGWVFFRAASLPQAWTMLQSMAGLGGSASFEQFFNSGSLFALCAGAILSVPVALPAA